MSATHKGCGGTILISAWPDVVEARAAGLGATYDYCDRCLAYGPSDRPLPSGTDRARNREAWDLGDQQSPSA